MAKRGSTKWLSVRQEEYIARRFAGKRSASSGAAVTDAGDVRTPKLLIECKHRGTFDKPARSVTIKLDDFEKVADEAWSESRKPVMALRIYCPESVLSDADGNVDIIARLLDDDKEGRYAE
jgi:hypothetical protein